MKTFISVLSSISGSSFAAGVHSHGEGQLDIAAEGRKVQIRIKSPLADVIGFEHSARNSKEKTRVKTALSSLSNPAIFIKAGEDCRVRPVKIEGLESLLKANGSHDKHLDECKDSHHKGHHDHHSDDHKKHMAECKDADHAKHHEGHEDHEKHMAECKDSHHQKHHDSDAHKKHMAECKDDEHKKHHAKDKHNDFIGEYELECKTSLKGRTLEVKLKKVIPNMKKVRVQFIGGAKPIGGVKTVSDVMRFEL